MLVGYTFHTDYYQQQHFSGKVDDIRFYNRVLSEDEIMELYLYSESNFSEFILNYALIKFQKLSASDSYSLIGGFTLGEESDGIDPLEEVVKLKVGTSNLEIPAGAFFSMGKKIYKFQGKIGDARVYMSLIKCKSNAFRIGTWIKGIDLTGTPNPVPIGLYIGDDAGQTDIWLSGVLNKH